jgi:hypothetical protein
VHFSSTRAASSLASSTLASSTLTLAITLLSLAGCAGIAGTPVGSASVPQSVTELGPYRHVPTPRWKEPDPAKVVKRSGEALTLENLYRESRYAELAAAAPAFLASNTPDDELRLFIANSLAWSNRSKDALAQYEKLRKTDYDNDAVLGIANVNRWSGKDHIAYPLYQELLKKDPNDKDAAEGLRLARREIAPKTTLRVGGSKDSSDIELRTAVLTQSWRDESLANIWEIESGRYLLSHPDQFASGNDVMVRRRSLDDPYKLRWELGANRHTALGGIGIDLPTVPVKLDIARLNWGRLSVNPFGLAANLTATRASAQINQPLESGTLFAQGDIARVSDGNNVVTSTIRFTPAWKPLDAGVKVFVGAETRDASFNTRNYWSPAKGYGAMFVGARGEWDGPDWNLGISGQLGTRLYGEAGRNWGATVSGKRWISNDWSIGFAAWAMASRRDEAAYRQRSLFVTIEKLWK